MNFVKVLIPPVMCLYPVPAPGARFSMQQGTESNALYSSYKP